MNTAAILLLLINLARPAAIPLKENVSLDHIAQNRAEYLCKMGQFSHAGWQKSFIGTDYAYVGENLARGFSSAVATHVALMASPTHRANILDKDYQVVGFGEDCGITVELFGGSAE